MSRICVKNLSKYVTEDQLREHFSLKGEITDAKLMKTKDGKSRQFAFIGFRSESEAKEAIRHFNKSFLGTSRIDCEIARKHGDPDIPRPWSRHSVNKSGEVNENENKAQGAVSLKVKSSKVDTKHNKEGSETDDRQLGEFLEVMKPRAQSKLWSDDSPFTVASTKNGKVGQKASQTEKGSKEKLGTLDVETKENATKELNIVNNVVISDKDYFKSKVKKDWSDSDSDIDDDDVEGDGHGDDKVSHLPNQSLDDNKGTLEEKLSKDVPTMVKEGMPSRRSDGETVDAIDSSNVEDETFEAGRLFIRNLPYTATEDELEEHFNKIGDTSEVHLVVDKETKQSKGFAYVRYTRPDTATRALEELDNTIFQGRLLHVMQAKKKYTSDKPEIGRVDEGLKTLKQRREEQKKEAEAGGDTRAWNSLFMRSDTVVENIARRHGVSKSDILDPEADDLAVRVALGETQVLAETKKALATAGVNVKSLEEIAAGNTDGLKRSKDVLLVKNLPYASSEAELAKMFGKFGSLNKIILPPTKTMGLVVFLQPSDARAAFRGLAYKRYKDAPLYLEWAPADILSPSATSKGDYTNNTAVDEDDVKRTILEQTIQGTSETDIDPDRTESRSLYVKNLNFKTSDDSLKQHFSKLMKEGKVLSARITKHKKNEVYVSKGFGFLEFDSVDTATNICRDLQGTVLDGHALILQPCHTGKDEQVKTKVGKDTSSTKLLVRNVAFEATEKDLRQLFSPFGQIKSLRLPKKLGTKQHRGFAFVEFVTKQETQNAMDALSSTHLYGRHLNLTRAKEGETLEELRERTAAHFADEQNGFQNSAKSSKKRKGMAFLDEDAMKFQRFDE
ncbi:Multiple RNA-binding domain-containing protein 1 [Linum perenne]